MSDTICGKCKQSIEGKTLTALGKSWHPEHFVCQICEKPITAVTFNERDGNPVCSECYVKKYSETCNQCKKSIVGKVVKAMGKSWHEDHFVCGGPCKKPMANTPFFEREGKPYCKNDFEKLFAAKCEGCSKPIIDNTVIALNAKWHKDCFRCRRCQKPVVEDTFTVEENKPICTSCVGN